MNRSILLLSLFSILFSCKTNKIQDNDVKLSIKPEIPIEKLVYTYGLIPINNNYKSSYTRGIITYFFDNKDNYFNDILGDFMNLRYITTNFNVMCDYQSDYFNYKHSLIFLIRRDLDTTFPFKGKTISVVSTKHGILLEQHDFKNKRINITERLFVKKLPIDKWHQAFEYIKNDTIILTVDNKTYRFISPENDSIK